MIVALADASYPARRFTSGRRKDLRGALRKEKEEYQDEKDLS